MKLPARVKDLGEVAANLHGLYVKEGDEWALKSADPGVASAIAAITGLSGALAASRKEAEDLKSSRTVDLSPLSSYGSDPASIAAGVKQTVETLTAKSGDQAKALEQVRKELAAQHVSVIQVKDKEIEALNGQLNKHLVDAQIAASAAARGVDVEMVTPFVRPNVSVIPDANGNRRPVIRDATGNVMYSTKIAGAEMGISEYMDTLFEQDRFKVLLPSKAPSGGAAQQSTTHNPVKTAKDVVKTPAQRITEGLAARAQAKK